MRRRSFIQASLVTSLALCGTGGRAQPLPAGLASTLAPTGKLRVAINYGNPVLATRDAQTGRLTGVSVDIAEELGRRVGLPLTLVPYDAAGKVSAAAAKDAWDVAFLARDPERAREISFTAAYVVINGNYAVRTESSYRSVNDVDQDGVRIAVSGQSVYDLYLARTLKHAKIVRAASPPEAAALFQSQRLEACAGVKSAMQQLVDRAPGLRLIDEPFMQINQAMGMPVGRAAAASYLAAFVESIKADGFVAKALSRHGQADASVAPAA